jgi:hypothetical protein
MKGDHEMDAAAPISGKVQEELHAAYLRVSLAASALRLWERVLTEQDRARLGGDFRRAYTEFGVIGMWMKLRGVSPQRAVIDVAKKIGFITDETRDFLLRGIGDLADNPAEAIAKGVSDGALVLVERPRTAHWDRRKIEVDWNANPKLWEYLFELCRHAKAGRPLSPVIFGENADPYHLTKLKSRLSKFEGFPPSLSDRIASAGEGMQRLDIPPERVRLFEVVTTEVLRERTG